MNGWKRVTDKPKVCWTNWTFGPWYSKMRTHRYIGIDLGPFNFTWRKSNRYEKPTFLIEADANNIRLVGMLTHVHSAETGKCLKNRYGPRC